MEGVARLFQEWNKERLQRMYVNYLKEEGYKPEIDQDGDVVFKHEGKTYVITIDERDPQFFRLVLPNIWSRDIDTVDAELLFVMAAAQVATAVTKVAKVHVVGNKSVWVSIELFVMRPEDFQGVFYRLLSAMDAAKQQFSMVMLQGQIQQLIESDKK